MARCSVNSCPHAGNTNAMATLTATSNFANCLKNMGFMRHLQEEMGRKPSITRGRAQPRGAYCAMWKPRTSSPCAAQFPPRLKPAGDDGQEEIGSIPERLLSSREILRR